MPPRRPASASDAATSALATRVSSRFSSDAWYSADRRAPSTVPSSASPYAAARAARAAPATNDFAYLESKDEADAVVSVDARPKSTLGRSDATTAVAGNVPGDDANEPPSPAGDGPDGLPVPGTPLEPSRDPPKDPKLPRDDASDDDRDAESGFAATAAPAATAKTAAAEAARAAALVAFDVETARRARERRRVRVRRWERPLPVAVSRLRRSPRGRRRRPPARVHRGAGCGPVLRRGQHGQAPAHLRVLGAPAGGRAVRPRDGARRHPRHDAAPAQHAPVCRRGARRLAGVLHARGRAQAVPDARRGGLLCVRR